MRNPLLAPLVSIAAGIVLSRGVDFSRSELVLAGCGLLGLSLVAGRWASRRTALASLWIALVCAGAWLELAHRPDPAPGLDAGSGESVILAGCVVEPSTSSETRVQFVLELEPEARARVSIYLREGEEVPALRYGQRIEIEARVRIPRNFENPGGFDYAGYLARRHIYWVASASSADALKRLAGPCGSRIQQGLFDLRTRALNRLDGLFAPGHAAMMRALLLGESSRLEQIWIDEYRRAGTYHVLVISGLHVTVLAGFLLFLMRLCSLDGGPGLAITALAAWVYAALTGGGTPVVRAAGGLTLYLVARYFYRRGRVLNLLAAVALAFLAVDPEQLFDAGFQLSFLSVAAIGALGIPRLEATSEPYRRGLDAVSHTERDLHLPPRVAQFRIELRLLAETIHYWSRIPVGWLLTGMALCLRGVFFVYGLVAVSAAVQVGLALPMAGYFHRISFAGLSANAIVVPATTLAVPVGFLAILTGWAPLASLGGALLSVSHAAVRWHARLEPDWRIPAPPLWLAAAFVAALLALALALNAAPRFRRSALACVAALLIFLILHPFPPRLYPGEMELTAIDVGQGESLLMALPEGKLVLIDGGGVPVFRSREKPRLDIGEGVVSTYLWSRSIRRLNAVAMTHAHEDHAGGLAALLENFRPAELWVGATGENGSWRALREKARTLGIKVVPLGGGTSFRYGGALVEALAPPAGYAPSDHARNNDSLVLRFSYGAHSFLLTGDAERQIEARLLAGGWLRHSDLLKVGHHGSRTSSTPPFLEVVRPSFAVISNGYENVYRFPHPAVLERLNQARSAIFRTDLFGAVTIRTDGRRIRADAYRWASPPRRRLRSAFQADQP